MCTSQYFLIHVSRVADDLLSLPSVQRAYFDNSASNSVLDGGMRDDSRICGLRCVATRTFVCVCILQAELVDTETPTPWATE